MLSELLSCAGSAISGLPVMATGTRLFRSVLWVLLVFTTAVSGLAQAPRTARSTMNARDYFNELQRDGGLPKWAENVCVAQISEDGNSGASTQVTNTSTDFILISDDDAHMHFQLYIRGVAQDALQLVRTFHDAHSSRFATVRGAALLGRPVHFQFNINWDTGRSEMDGVKGSVFGLCEGVN
jgi:hypothetical protein